MKRTLIIALLFAVISGCGGGGSSSGGGVADTSQAAGTYVGIGRAKVWVLNDPSTAEEESFATTITITDSNTVIFDEGSSDPVTVPVMGGPSRFTGAIPAATVLDELDCDGDLALDITVEGSALTGTFAGVSDCRGIRVDTYVELEAQRAS